MGTSGGRELAQDGLTPEQCVAIVRAQPEEVRVAVQLLMKLQHDHMRAEHEQQIDALRQQDEEAKKLREEYAAKQRALASAPEPPATVTAPAPLPPPVVGPQPDLIPLIRQIAAEVVQVAIRDHLQQAVPTSPPTSMPMMPPVAPPTVWPSPWPVYNPHSGRRW